MNKYLIEILAENDLFLFKQWVVADNKIMAINNAMNMMLGWRNKDSIKEINIIAEDINNIELSANDYN